MAGKRGDGESLRCSFCNKDQRDVKKLIAGPTVYICDECVDICLDIIAEEREPDEPKAKVKLPKPVEIREFLDEYVIGQDKAKKKLAVAEEQHPAHRADGDRQDPSGADAREAPERAVRHRRRDDADRGRLRGRGRREHPAATPAGGRK